jgi:hypothetical protein
MLKYKAEGDTLPVVYTESNYRIVRANPRYFPKNVILTEEDQQRLEEYIKARKRRKAKFNKQMRNISNRMKAEVNKQVSSKTRKGH